jgi:hypothetical protein
MASRSPYSPRPARARSSNCHSRRWVKRYGILRRNQADVRRLRDEVEGIVDARILDLRFGEHAFAQTCSEVRSTSICLVLR